MLTEITAEPKGTVTDAHEAWNWSEHVELDLSNKIKREKKERKPMISNIRKIRRSATDRTH